MTMRMAPGLQGPEFMAALQAIVGPAIDEAMAFIDPEGIPEHCFDSARLSAALQAAVNHVVERFGVEHGMGVCADALAKAVGALCMRTSEPQQFLTLMVVDASRVIAVIMGEYTVPAGQAVN